MYSVIVKYYRKTMGLLDFISKSSGNAQTGDDTQTYDPQTQTSPTNQFSDIQYPMPSSQNTTATNTGVGTDPMDFRQYTFNEDKAAAQNIPAEDQALDITQTDNVADLSNTEVEDLSKYSSNNAQPIENTPVANDINNFGNSNPVPSMNDWNLPKENNLPSVTDIPQPVEIEQTLPAAGQETPTATLEPVNDNLNQDTINDAYSMYTSNTPAVDSTVAPTEPSVEIPEQKATNEQVVSVPEIPVDPVIEDSAVNQVQLSSQEQPKEEAKAVEEPKESTELVIGTENPQPEVKEEVIQEDKAIEEQPKEDKKQKNIKQAEEVVEEKETEIIPSVMPKEEKIVEEKQSPIETEIAPIQSEYGFKKIKNVAFIGLNSKTFGNVSLEIRTIADFLAKKGMNILIDSNKGYGNDLLTTIESLEKAKVTAVHFKPFYTNYSDETDRHSQIHDYTTVVYSDLIERLKYFIRESEAFIFPEVTGLLNMSALTTLLSLQYLYQGQHKPVILIGNKWNSKIEKLKEISGMTDEEFKSVIIVSTAEDAVKILTDSDEKMSTESKFKSRKFYDYREDFDEYEYMN